MFGGVWALAPILFLGACGGSDDGPAPAPSISVAAAATQCPALAGSSVPASAFGLATSGATVTTAALVPAVAASGASLATPEYCKVTGSISAANAADPPILFQLNMPTQWNVKTLQFGGGGFNGTVVTGVDNITHAPSTSATPLQRNYATFGGDSGHQAVGLPRGDFALNAQALANYAGESVKRTRDAAVALMNTYYKAAPQKTYYAGESKGGHEGLVATQRYASDYDGVIAYYPADQNQAMVLSWDRMYQAANNVPGAALNAAKQALLKASVLSACDALDGVADGIVSNLSACSATFAVNSLRCPGGADTGDTCLSDLQINTLITAATPMQFAFPLANGLTHIGPYPVLNGGDLFGIMGAYGYFDGDVISYFIQQSASAPSANFDYRPWQSRVQFISNLYDSTNPNIDAFKAKGGKLILVQGTTDMLVTHVTTTEQVERMSARYGSDLKAFVRYYVVPGHAHGDGDFIPRWDALSALESWAEAGTAPTNPVGTDAATATAGRSRPLCEYPAWPKYNGSGDVNSAASFTCVAD
jgi:hypothetical protein